MIEGAGRRLAIFTALYEITLFLMLSSFPSTDISTFDRYFSVGLLFSVLGIAVIATAIWHRSMRGNNAG